MSILFNKMFSLENMELAYKKSLKQGGQYKQEALIFQRNETVNLMILRRQILSGTYQFKGYSTFTVYEPKERIINAPFYRDKIVQLAMNEILKDIFNVTFIRDSYACIEEKGTHKAVDKVQSNFRKAQWEYGKDAYIVKVDVRKFFYSIDRDILKKLYRKKIKEDDVLWMLDHIIDSGALIDEVGLPLGNTLSQLCANIYLNELDQYCTRYLGCKYYVRYADDIVIVVPNKEVAQIMKNKCVTFLNERLNLQANMKKSQIYPIDQGANCFGFKIYRTHRLLRDDSKKKIKRKIKKMPRLISEGLMTVETANQMLSSWAGHASYGSSKNFIDCILARRPYIMRDGNKLLINEEALRCYIKTKTETSH